MTRIKPAQVRMKLRLEFANGLLLGPGKAELLEGIRETGSIAAAGRRMKMSYKRAWDLVEAMNRCLREPVVHTSKGGSGGGGASLTATGEAVLAHYRRLEAAAAQAAAAEVRALQRLLRAGEGGHGA